ncbi:Adcy10 [Columba livia]|nr:Adcy10 [Columba livia]
MAPQPGILAFCDLLQWEVAYELWPERCRVTVHRKCATFLEQYADQCKSCSQGDFVPLQHFGVTSTQDGGSCQGPADLGNSGTWAALVLAGEELQRNRPHITEGVLCTVLCSTGSPGGRGCVLGIGGSRSARGWDDEIVTFHSHLKAYQDFGERHILVFESLTGSGKSHLLTELAYIAQDAGQRVVAVELLEINVRQHYTALRKIMARVLGLQDCEQCSDMEQRLETELQGTRKRADIASSMTFSQSSLAPGYVGTEKLTKVTANTRIQTFTILHLSELNLSAVVQKVCDALGVVGISRDLASHFSNRLIRAPLLHPVSAVEALLLTEISSSTAEDDGRVCIIRPDISLDNMVLPTTLKAGPIKTRGADDLEVCSCHWPVFTAQMLSHIVPAADRHKVNYLLDTLVRKNILKWLKITEVPEDAQDPTEGPATSVQAEAGVQSSSLSIKIMVLQPGILAFCDPLQREVAYELWPERQRVTVYRKCAALLEQYAYQCSNCSHGDFVPLQHFGVSSTQDGGSCQGPADLGNSGTWAALVLAGEELQRNRIHITDDDSG